MTRMTQWAAHQTLSYVIYCIDTARNDPALKKAEEWTLEINLEPQEWRIVKAVCEGAIEFMRVTNNTNHWPPKFDDNE